MGTNRLIASRNCSDWLYARRATSWDAMTNLPKTLREKLRETFFAANAGTGPQAGFARHHAEISLEAGRRLVHRKRFDSREPGALRRGERPPHALHFHASRLRLRLQDFARADSTAGNAISARMKLWSKFWRVERWHVCAAERRKPGTERPTSRRQQHRRHGHGRAAGEL